MTKTTVSWRILKLWGKLLAKWERKKKKRKKKELFWVENKIEIISVVGRLIWNSLLSDGFLFPGLF